MKRLTLIFVLATVAGASVLVTSALAAPTPSGRCRPVAGTGHTEATSLAGPFVGAADIVIGGTSYSGVPLVTSILAPLAQAGESGVFFTTTSHSFAVPGVGTITTTDDARLIATQDPGVFRLVSHMSVTGGASGELHLQGRVSFATFPFAADATVVGAICGV